MVYLGGPSVKTLAILALILVVISLNQDVEAGTMKFAYTKPIFGKANTIKEKRFMLKPDFSRKATIRPSTSTTLVIPTTRITTLTPPQALAPPDFSAQEATTPLPLENDNKDHVTGEGHIGDNIEAEAAINVQDMEEALPIKRWEDNSDAQIQFMVIDRLKAKTADNGLLSEVEPLENNTLEALQQCNHPELCDIGDYAKTLNNMHEVNNIEAKDEIEELYPLPKPELLIAPRLFSTRNTPNKASKSTTKTTTESGRLTPCTCGVFLTSQIKGRTEQPEGAPVITNELDRTFPCNAVGQKQCQTKCLETIVQHLPNSANILCATLNRDCRKERAYLFIKNCRNQWFNTSLAAGREYCCREGEPYTCPLV